jgi:hypothetical protein
MDRYFYIVEEYNGQKEIHFSGNIYYNDADGTDKCFRIAEWTGLYITVDKLKELLEEDMIIARHGIRRNILIIVLCKVRNGYHYGIERRIATNGKIFELVRPYNLTISKRNSADELNIEF